ncbi:MAG TPA: hypothetical protein PLU50_02940 [Pseudobdellovibrionaceae bacterium]|nr:hypothetical protein [Pseudobdellovibrionaceae bacterium]
MTENEMNEVVEKTKIYIDKSLSRFGYSFMEFSGITIEASKATNDRSGSVRYLNNQVRRRIDFNIRFACDGSDTCSIAIWAKALDRPYSYMLFSEPTTVEEALYNSLRWQQPGQSVDEYLQQYFALVNKLFDGEWNKYIMGKDFKPFDIDDRLENGVNPKAQSPKLKIVKNNDES